MRLSSVFSSVLVFALGAASLLVGQPGCGHCLALPSCPVGEKAVTDCPKGATCHDVELCGETITCTKDASCAAAPVCGAGTVEVATCPPGATCTTVSICNTTLLCAPLACSPTSNCPADRYCSYPDGRCGAGAAGECKARPNFCSDGPDVCFCDGTTAGMNGLPCAGLMGFDLDATGTACKLGATAFSCGYLVCDGGTRDFCQRTPSDTGGLPAVSCSQAPATCDPANCACLTTETQACNGTCVDGPNGPTITCPGG